MVKKAFIIALNYFGSQYQLYGCINDAIEIEAKYRRLGFTEFVKRIEKTGCEPRVKETLADLEKFITESKEGDILAFHYSGHGSQTRDVSGDEKDGVDEVICLLDGHILDDKLNDIMVKKLPRGVKLRCLFDCCHSGSCMDLSFRMNESGNGLEVENSYPQEDKNVIMISGCRDNQTSADAWIAEARMSQGAMTWSWLKALQWMDTYLPNATWKDVLAKMKFLLAEEGYRQVPQLSASSKDLVFSKLDFLSPVKSVPKNKK